MLYTEDDVQCVCFTQFIDDVNVGLYDGQKTPSEVIYSEKAETFDGSVKSSDLVWQHGDWHTLEVLYDLRKAEDRKIFKKECVQPALARYERGKKLLETQQLIFSKRWMMGCDDGYEEMTQGKEVTSPAIVVSVGYEHTTEYFQLVALASRKKVA